MTGTNEAILAKMRANPGKVFDVEAEIFDKVQKTQAYFNPFYQGENSGVAIYIKRGGSYAALYENGFSHPKRILSSIRILGEWKEPLYAVRYEEGVAKGRYSVVTSDLSAAKRWDHFSGGNHTILRLEVVEEIENA